MFKVIAVFVAVYYANGSKLHEKTIEEPVPHTPRYASLEQCRDDLTQGRLWAAVGRAAREHAVQNQPRDSDIVRIGASVRCARGVVVSAQEPSR